MGSARSPDVPGATTSAALGGSAPGHDWWCGWTVAEWIAHRLERPICRQLGWAYLRRLGARLRVPRSRHVEADPQAQAELKQHVRPLLREVATAFPHATVELWARGTETNTASGSSRSCTGSGRYPGQRLIAPVGHRYDWRYLVGFVHPATGRTVWHLASTVSIEIFSVELEAFAREVGASPTKQIVLILDGAGWHESPKVRVPEHVHLLFLPPHSPELQPAEHLWPLTNTVLVNRHCQSALSIGTSPASRSWRTPKRGAAPRCKPARISSAPRRSSIGGLAAVSNAKDQGEPGISRCSRSASARFGRPGRLTS